MSYNCINMGIIPCIGGINMKQPSDRLIRSILRTIVAIIVFAIAILNLWFAFALGKVSANIFLIFIFSTIGTTLSFLAVFLISPIFCIVVLGMLIEKISQEDFRIYHKKLQPYAKRLVEKYLW